MSIGGFIFVPQTTNLSLFAGRVARVANFGQKRWLRCIVERVAVGSTRPVHGAHTNSDTSSSEGKNGG